MRTDAMEIHFHCSAQSLVLNWYLKKNRMALYSSHTSVVKRSSGQNAIASAAYNSRSKLTLYVTDKETNITVPLVWDYSKMGGLAFSKIYAPDHAPEWVYDRETLWNKCEEAENRCNSQPARKIRKALPVEFTKEQNIALLEEFAKEISAKGMIVDANIHDDTPNNPHGHLMLTMRELVKDRYGEYEFSHIKNREWGKAAFVKWHRQLWADLQNKHYKMNGYDITVSPKSYKELGIDLEPTAHEGPARNIKNSELTELNRQIGAENAERIKAKPSIILDVLGLNNPVFTKEQIATELEKRLHAGIDFSKIDNIESLQSELSATFNILYEKILVCPEISQVVEADLKGRTLYTTTKRLELEERFVANVEELHSRNSHALDIKDSDLDHLSWSEKMGAKLRDVKTDLIENINDKTVLKLEKPRQDISLSKEQRKAVVNVLNGSDISVLEGIPGAGKTTVMREMVRQYKKAGFKVIGVAPSSAASLELAKATGIECKNASLWRKEWLQAQGKQFELILRGDYYKEDLYKDTGSSLTKKHVMIIDEASMGELSNMDYLISEAKSVGAKILKVGDSNQLSPVGWAGALDKTISICGSETLSESRRQQKETHQEVTKLLSQYRVRDALDIYWKEGVIKVADNESEANSMAVRSFVSSYIETAKAIERDDLISTRSKAIGVFENKTRNLLNTQVREQLKEAGILKGQEQRVLVGSLIKDGKYEKQYLNFSRGEQIVFARNANRLGKGGIFNGELGTILKIHKPDKDALAKIDILVHRANGTKEKVLLDLAELANNKYVGRYFHDGISIDHGYAVTSHKVQGASIDDFVMRPEKNVGFEVFNVLSTRHKQNLEIIGDRETLKDAFYEALDETASKAKNRFELKPNNEEIILKGGLAKMISKRSNTSFAGDYRTMGQTEEDKYIKHYINKSEETIATLRKITSWQNIEQRSTGTKPQMWEHKDWQEFLDTRKDRSLAASTIMVGFEPNGKLSGDAKEEYSHLTSAEFRKECLSASYAKFKDRIVQLGMNYATIEKHASQFKGKGSELDKVIVDQKITILHEQDIFKELVQSVSSGQTVSIRNSCALVNVHIADTNIAIEEKNTEINELENSRQELTDAIETETHYRKILTPEYLSRIYRTEKGSQEDSGVLALKKYEAILLGHGADKAIEMVVKEPSLLGDLKGYGVGRLFGINNDRKDAIELCKNLGKQLNAYNRSGEMIEQYKVQMTEGDFGTKLFELSEEIEHLRSLLPADIDNELIQEVEGRLQKTKSNNIDWRDLQKSELFETVRVGQYAEKENSIFTSEDTLVVNVDKKAISKEMQTAPVKDIETSASVVENRNIDTQVEKAHVDKEPVANRATIAVSADNELKQQFKKKADTAAKQQQQQQQNSKPSLTFLEVKAGLNQSIISEIFHRYGAAIVSNKPIEKKGDQLKIGSLYMSTAGSKTGLWNRFSDGSKGDIFSFVEAATGCSKYESLEIVASHAGIVVSNPQESVQKHVANIGRGATQRKNKVNNTKQQVANSWVAQSTVTSDVLKFNPKKDLSFLINKGNVVTNTHEYRNKDSQLLGYTVRVEETKSDKKQVLPVAYCHNEAKQQSRWQLKGFSDAGSKPIYGLEKLKQNPEKPILIVEGEKTADAASKLLPDHNVISWMGGAQAVDKVDWSKLSNKVVSIWPDNDKPGICAAQNIANHIDCHNGFSGLVSVVDTKQLELPNKWDLADELPKDIELSKNNLSSVIDNQDHNVAKIGKKLWLSQEQCNPLDKDNYKVLDSVDMLIVTNRISKDAYISKEIYNDSLISIASSKNIDLGQIEDYKDFVSNVSSIQEEYQSLHREYEQNILKKQNIASSISSNSKSGLNTKEQLAHDLIRNTSVLHQVQLGQNKLTTIHTEHIEKAVNAEIGKIHRFTDSDKKHAANNIYKTINSEQWRDELDAKNHEQAHSISIRFTAKSIDEFLVGTKLSTTHNESQEHLKNIRKYGIDESDLLTTFKEGHIAGSGAAELKEMSDRLTIASGFAEEHSSLIDEAIRWGYKASDTDITRSLVGMDTEQSENHCIKIRNNALSSYLNTHIAEFTRQKQYRPDMTMDNMKSVIKQEQDFLKEVHKEVQAPIADYSYNCRSKLEDGKVAHENPELLNKSFAVMDKLQDEHELSHRDIAFKVAQISDSSQMFKSLDKEYEYQQCFVCPKIYSEQRASAGSSKELLTIIGKEQDYLGSLHGNIKYHDYDKDLLAKCELAHKQKEGNALDSLKDIAHQSLASGAKSEEELVSDLQQVTNLKEAHSKLDKGIEAHHINSTLRGFEAEKQSAKTPNEIMSVIAKQQEFLVGLDGNLKYSEIHGSDVHQSITEAKNNKENGVTQDLQQALEANQKQGIKSDKELTDILNNSHEHIPKVVEELKETAAFNQKIHLRRQRVQIGCLEKLNYNVDKDKLVREVKSMTSEEREKYVDNILAKEIKKYVEPLMAHHTEEKVKATNSTELMAALAKEQATYVHLHKDHEMAIYALDKSNGNMKLSVAASCANDIHNLGGIKYAQKVIDHAIDHNIRTDNKIFDDLRNGQGNIKILSESLHKECTNHHRDQLDGHLKDLARNQDVFIGHHRFKDASTYLHHITKYHNHDYIPTDLINKHLQHIEHQRVELSKQVEHQHEHENQKELHMNKGMGGPSK